MCTVCCAYCDQEKEIENLEPQRINSIHRNGFQIRFREINDGRVSKAFIDPLYLRSSRDYF